MRVGENESLRTDLAALVRDHRASNDIADRVAYARDLWPRHVIGVRKGEVAPAPPAVVVWPSDVEELCRIVRYARERAIPLVPFGAGSGVCGGIEASRDAVIIDMKAMRRVLSIDREQLLVHAQAGILGQHLEDELASEGLTLGHFPSSIYCSTLGGWLAARSAGQCSGRYGKIEDMVERLRFVDSEGRAHEAVRGGENAELLPLLIGSEGILGIITDAVLRISPAPSERVFASFTMPTTEAGLHTIRDLYQAGLRPAVARLYDPFDTRIARSRSSHEKKKSVSTEAGPGFGTRLLVRALRYPGAMNALIHSLPDSVLGGAMLVLVWEDDVRISSAEKLRAHDIALSHGGVDSGEEPARRWLKRRHSVSYRQSPMFAAGAFVDTMEVAAPWSRLWPTFNAVREAIAPYAFVMAHFSHAYPDGGSIYFTFAGSARDDTRATEIYDRLWADALRAAVMAGATFSHHHGVGRSKAPAMRRELGSAVDLVRTIKNAMDASGILNPGSLLPNEEKRTHAAVVMRELPSLETMTRVLSVDRDSRTLHVEGGALLRDVERVAKQHGCSLFIDSEEESLSVAQWIATRARLFGSSGDDPVAQRIAGLDLALCTGEQISIRPAPRRAVGPDLMALFVGQEERIGRVLSAYLVMRTDCPTKIAAFRFRDDAQANAARAWMRGRGVRAIDSSVRNGVLALRYDATGFLGERRAAIIDELAHAHEGVRLHGPVLVMHAAAKAQPSELIAKLRGEIEL